MKYKKGLSGLSMILAVTIMGLLIILLVSSGNKIFGSTSNTIDSSIMSTIRTDDGETIDDRVKTFKDAGTESYLTDDQLNYGKKLATHLFKFNEEQLKNEKGQLLAFYTPTQTEIRTTNDLFIISSSEGVIFGYNDQINQQKYVLVSSEKPDYEFLKAKDICILTFEDDDSEDAKKVLSYASNLPHDGANTIPTKEEIFEIMAANTVDQISIASSQIKYFKGNEFHAIRLKDKENNLAYSLNGITCIFPARNWAPSHVRLKTDSNGPYFKGDGQIHTDLLNALRSKISTIQQGDFS